MILNSMFNIDIKKLSSSLVHGQRTRVEFVFECEGNVIKTCENCILNCAPGIPCRVICEDENSCRRTTVCASFSTKTTLKPASLSLGLQGPPSAKH